MSIRSAIAAFIFFSAVALPACGQLLAKLRDAINNAGLGNDAIAGVAIHDANSGLLIYESNGTIPLAPASNQKLLTSASATLILGPAYTFTTDLTQAEDGSIVLIGTGDPAFGDPRILAELDATPTPDDALDAFAEAAAKRVGQTAPELIVDDRIFDRNLIHPDWPRDQLERWYCAPVQGVNVHTNVLAFYPAPNSGGVSASIEPHGDWIDITDRAQVISEGRNAVWIQRSDTDDSYTIRGSIKSRAQAPIEVSLHQPALFTGKLLAERLADSGVQFASSLPADAVRLVRPDEQLVLNDEPFARWTTPLADILHRCNHASMNLHAEALVKSLGHAVTGEQGTWQNGNAVIRMLLSEKLGPAAVAGTIIRDGSGLSRENRIAAATMSAWLAAMHSNPDVREMYRTTLPRHDGKLARRFSFGSIQNEVFAKTGTINHVRCLSGYVIDPETGRAASFSILCNGLTSGQAVRASYRLQGAIVEALDSSLGELSLPVDRAPALGG